MCVLYDDCEEVICIDYDLDDDFIPRYLMSIHNVSALFVCLKSLQLVEMNEFILLKSALSQNVRKLGQDTAYVLNGGLQITMSMGSGGSFEEPSPSG